MFVFHVDLVFPELFQFTHGTFLRHPVYGQEELEF